MMIVNHHIDGRSLRLQTAITTRLSSGWSWRMAQVVPPQYAARTLNNQSKHDSLSMIISKTRQISSVINKAINQSQIISNLESHSQ
jgi:hypothetical protein